MKAIYITLIEVLNHILNVLLSARSLKYSKKYNVINVFTQLLNEELNHSIHALALHLFTPEEWKAQNETVPPQQNVQVLVVNFVIKM